LKNLHLAACIMYVKSDNASEGEVKMNEKTGFWPAFVNGLASPVSIYAQPPNYYRYVSGYTLPQTFAIVGSTMSYTAGVAYGGQSPEGNHATGVVGLADATTVNTKSAGRKRAASSERTSVKHES
jgi:hypothetical protein